MPHIYDMGPTALLPLRRKACWGFFRPKNPTASAGFEPANLGTKGQYATPRPPKPLHCSIHLCFYSLQSTVFYWLEEANSLKAVSWVQFLIPSVSHNGCFCFSHWFHLHQRGINNGYSQVAKAVFDKFVTWCKKRLFAIVESWFGQHVAFRTDRKQHKNVHVDETDCIIQSAVWPRIVSVYSVQSARGPQFSHRLESPSNSRCQKVDVKYLP